MLQSVNALAPAPLEIKLSKLTAKLINASPVGVIVDHDGFKFGVAAQAANCLGSYVVKSSLASDYPASSVADAVEWMRVCVLVEKDKKTGSKQRIPVGSKH